MSLSAASNPATPSTQLHRLARSRDRSVREAVAVNPNTAADDLDRLAYQFAEAVAANASLDWLTLTRAEWLADFDSVSRHRLLMAPNCPVGLLWWAVRFGHEEDQLAVLNNPACPEAVVNSLIESDDLDVRQTVALRQSKLTSEEAVKGAMRGLGDVDELAELLATGLLPAWVVGSLDVPADVDARRELARHDQVSPETLNGLLGDEDDLTRRIARTNSLADPAAVALWGRLALGDPDLDTDDLDRLAHGSYARERVAAHPAVSAQALERCVSDVSWRVREAAATNPNISESMAMTLAVDNDRDVRAMVARNSRLPRFVLHAMSLDRDQRVLDVVAAQLKRDAKPILMTRPDAEESGLRVHAWALTADLSGETEASLAAFLEHHDPYVRIALSRNPTLPAAVEALLGANGYAEIKSGIAQRTTNVDLLVAFVADETAEVRICAARNSNLPGWLAWRMVDDVSEDVKSALLLNHAKEVEFVAKLLGVTNLEVAGEIQRVIGGESEPVSAEAVELLRTHGWAGLAAVRQPLASPAILSALHDSPSWRVREAVGAHSNTAHRDLVALSTDGDNDVRSAVAANPRIHPGDFPAFFTESDDKLRRALVARVDLPATLVEAHLASDDGVRVDWAVHPNIDRNSLAHYQALVCGTQISPDRLSAFARGPGKKLAASHPQATMALLHELSEDSNWTIREAVASNANCAVEDLRVLAEDHDRDVRAAVAVHPGCPRDVLHKLAQDSDDRVRRAVLRHPGSLESQGKSGSPYQRTLTRLQRSSDPLVRVVALLDPQTDATALRRLRHTRSVYWLERWAVATHRNTPSATRAALAADPLGVVRHAARSYRKPVTGP